MSISRRVVLQGASLASLATLFSSSVFSAFAQLQSTSYKAIPVLLLASDAPTSPKSAREAEGAFIGSVRLVASHDLSVQRMSFDLRALRVLDQQLRSATPLRIVGLLDNGLANLVIDAARNANARVHWLGWHHATHESIQHRIQISEASECIQHRNEHSSQWLHELGVMLAAGDRAVPPLLKQSPNLDTPITGSFVSLSIDVGRDLSHG